MNILSVRSLALFFLFAIILAWMLPEDWVTAGPGLLSPASPYTGIVQIEDVSWGGGAPYVSLSVGDAALPISLSGWSIENDLGDRAEIGEGVEHFILGAVNPEGPIVVATGSVTTLSFSPSPVGSSFRENACSGYLRGTRAFSPLIEERCPSMNTSPLYPSLDATCKALIESSPRCQTISPEHLADVSSPCGQFLRTVPTYAYCMEHTKKDEGAAMARWRIFLPGKVLVREEGGAIILLDARGNVVDEYAYLEIGLP